MARWPQDDVDVACESWAFQWVQHFGRDPDRAARYVGATKCTLGRIRELHDGAASRTESHSQHWPEVFLGQALLVNLALGAMSLASRRITWAHYVARCYDATTWARRPRPTKQSIIASDLGVSLAEYYTRRDVAKECIRTVLALGRAERPQAARAGSLHEPGAGVTQCVTSPVWWQQDSGKTPAENSH